MAGPSRLGFVCTHLCFAGTAGARVRQVHVQMNGILRVILEGLRVIAIHMTVCAVLLDVCWGFVGFLCVYWKQEPPTGMWRVCSQASF